MSIHKTIKWTATYTLQTIVTLVIAMLLIHFVSYLP